MPSPYYFKQGWDREKMAEYILSRFSFVAKPSTVSDDLGTDLFCTLFRLTEKEGIDYPLPLSSFAIQIKSSDATFDFSANISYLKKLELPFFVGVVNESAKELSIFSGENLPIFFPHIGTPKKLKIKLIERNQMNAPYNPIEGRQNDYTIMFPKIITTGIDSTKEELKETVELLGDLCSLIQRNIATRKIEEYIFDQYDKKSYFILAGPGSFEKYRDNFMKRLAENFFNLEWKYDQLDDKEKEILIEEFRIYEDTYLKIKKIYPTVHGILTDQYNNLKLKLRF